jgi:cytochrome P450
VQVVNVKEDIANGVKPDRKTIFHTLLDADAEDGRKVRSTQNLADEAMSITSAAADSTGNAISYAVYSVMTTPGVKERVTEELKRSFPDPCSRLDLVSLEKLPYLTGVIKEAQRCVASDSIEAFG